MLAGDGKCKWRFVPTLCNFIGYDKGSTAENRVSKSYCDERKYVLTYGVNVSELSDDINSRDVKDP